MGRKIIRGAGIAVCVLLFLLCVFLLIISAAFGSDGVVGAFGYNLYVCEESAYEGLASGSAVVVERCEPYDLDEGMLIMYCMPAEEGEKPYTALGYTETVTHKDGVYSITVSDTEDNKTLISQGDFIGRAGWSSPALGKLISFSLTPWGVLVMAVLPCLVLIIYSVIKGVVDAQPLPEIEPQFKNSEREEPKPQSGISVKADGNAEYSCSANSKAPHTADSVLFTYGTKNGKSPAAMKPDVPASQPAKPAPKPAAKTAPAASEKTANSGGVPSSVAARKYIDSATAAHPPKSAPAKPAAEEKKPVAAGKVSGNTAEIPQIPKKKKNDAFFTQSSAPQIGRQRPSAQNRAVIDLEDALATVNDKRESTNKKADATSKRSADILAAKRRDELMTDDDDSRDKSRYEVDDILAGIDRRHRS